MPSTAATDHHGPRTAGPPDPTPAPARHAAMLPLAMPVLLAPMAGITDLPFRRLVARFGAGLVVSEMIACRELLGRRRGAQAAARLRLEGGGEAAAGQPPEAVQIAGCEAEPMAEAARIAEAEGAAVIDINMGCPSKRVTGGMSGSALMRDADAALRLVEAVRGAVAVPVTLKMRLGWDDASCNAPQIAARAEAAGVAMITIHGRTRCQFYTGAADWAAIRAVVTGVGVPVVANGDIVDPASARAALAASGAAAVMVGRGARGAPWRLAQIAAALRGAPAPEVPKGDALADLVAAHLEAMLSFYGPDLGLRVARKHLGWYLETAGPEGGHRRAVVTAETPRAALAALRRAFAAMADPAPARTPAAAETGVAA